VSIDIKFNNPTIKLEKKDLSNLQFTEYLGKSQKNDSLFLEEVKKISTDILPLLQNLKYPNAEILEKYGYTKDRIYNAILKETKISNISIMISLVIVLTLMALAALSSYGVVMTTNRQRLEYIITLLVYGGILYLLSVYIGTLLFNADINIIKQILKYSQ